MRSPLTLIVQQPSQDPRFAGGTTPREFHKVDELAAELTQAAGSPVAVVEGPLAQAPAAGFLLVFNWYEIEQHPELGPRTLLVGVSPSEVWNPHPEQNILSRYRLAGAIEASTFFEWISKHQGSDLFGLRSVGAAAGLHLRGMPFKSDYDHLLSYGRCKSFADLIVHYLDFYERFLDGAAATP